MWHHPSHAWPRPRLQLLQDAGLLSRAAGATLHWSSARIVHTCREAAMQALREDIGAQQVDRLHFARVFGI